MLERLSGWAGDGVNMPQEMLQSLLTVATATAAGKQAIVELVSGWSVAPVWTSVNFDLPPQVRAGGSHVKGIKKWVVLPSHPPTPSPPAPPPPPWPTCRAPHHCRHTSQDNYTEFTISCYINVRLIFSWIELIKFSHQHFHRQLTE